MVSSQLLSHQMKGGCNIQNKLSSQKTHCLSIRKNYAWNFEISFFLSLSVSKTMSMCQRDIRLLFRSLSLVYRSSQKVRRVCFSCLRENPFNMGNTDRVLHLVLQGNSQTYGPLPDPTLRILWLCIEDVMTQIALVFVFKYRGSNKLSMVITHWSITICKAFGRVCAMRVPLYSPEWINRLFCLFRCCVLSVPFPAL